MPLKQSSPMTRNCGSLRGRGATKGSAFGPRKNSAKRKFEAEAYAGGLLAADVQKAGSEQIVKTIRADFDRAGVAVTDPQIRKQMEELFAAAVEELTKGTGQGKKAPG